MIANKRLDLRPMEQAGALHGISSESVEQQRTQNASEPLVCGNVETFLAAMENSGREFVAHEVAEHHFEIPATDLLILWQARGELHNAARSEERRVGEE